VAAQRGLVVNAALAVWWQLLSQTFPLGESRLPLR
jgi:hypothetical protein